MTPVGHNWPVLAAITLLAVDYCNADRPCIAYSNVQRYVQLGSSFQVYCTFNASYHKCKKMYMCMEMKEQLFGKYNSTTIYLNVTKIEQNRTYSCSCNTCPEAADPCGLDVFTGYPPGIPKNLTCIQKGELGPVNCSWIRGRETYLGTTSKLWVKIVTSNSTVELSYTKPQVLSGSGSEWLMVGFKVPGSFQAVFSVWVEAINKLGSANSTIFNFTLNDIVRPLPPELTRVECSSRHCDVRVKVANRIQQLEVQYSSDQESWITWPLTDLKTGPERAQSIQLLEPYKFYNFRARTKFSTRWWSEWSKNISNWTEEEEPAKALDVWHTRPNPISITLHWKKLHNSGARGKILQYEVELNNLLTGMTSSTNTSANHQTVQFCSDCEVKVYAWNSKGRSPPKSVSLVYRKEPAPQSVSCRAVNNHSVAISWQEPVKQVLEYLVEWYPAGRQDTHLSWHRLGPKERNTVLTDNIKPYECYEGAVYALYKGAVGRTTFLTATWESAPSCGPAIQKVVEGLNVIVSWKEVPWEQRRGCVIGYTIYVEQEGNSKVYNCSSSVRTFSTSLTPSAEKPYKLWMTAWTARGESPSGESVLVFLQTQQGQPNLLAWVVLLFCAFIILCLLCLCQNSTARHRFLNIVPDPANSKWAKECVEKGKLSRKIYLNDSSWSEEEPDMVDVQELTKESWTSGSVASTADPADLSNLPLLQPSPSPMTSPVTTLSPQSSYLKSFSLESDSSECTQGSQETDTTEDYISTYGSGQVIEEVEDVQSGFLNGVGFLPNLFMGSLIPSEGKITLDCVMIDCSDFESGFENQRN